MPGANCSIEMTGPNKRVIRIRHSNGRIIAEMLVHGPFEAVLANCEQQSAIVSGRPNIFRGELWGLAGYQLLDIDNEEIIEK